jgi:glyceraldehyde 3-phosphate dehydrogenase
MRRVQASESSLQKFGERAYIERGGCEMSTSVAINGLGRIGRAILKLVMDEPALELVAVNDLIDIETLAYLLRFDTVYGRYTKSVVVDGDDLAIAGRKVRTLRSRDPLDLPWRELGVDLVFECTGALARREDLEKHIRAGARTVLLSAPSKGGEVEGMRGGRAAAANLIPASTGAALATTRALPQYAGLFDGIAIRAPIPIGSIADITFVTSRKTTVDEVNGILTGEAETERYAGVLGVSSDPLVSSDVIADPRASIVDLELTRVVDGDLVKVMSWYDNEWGYANQMLREAVSVARGAGSPST